MFKIKNNKKPKKTLIILRFLGFYYNFSRSTKSHIIILSLTGLCASICSNIRPSNNHLSWHSVIFDVLLLDFDEHLNTLIQDVCNKAKNPL